MRPWAGASLPQQNVQNYTRNCHPTQSAEAGQPVTGHPQRHAPKTGLFG